MDLTEAWEIFHDYYGKSQLTELDLNAFIEASEFLLFHKKLGDADRMPVLFNLASFYYDQEIYRLSEKYFRMLAEEYSSDVLVSGMAYTSLAKLYYYGHAGVPDYHRAYDCICRALEKDEDSLQARVLKLFIARHGYGGFDENHYLDAVFDLSDEIFERNIPGVTSIPVPEILFLVCEVSLTGEEDMDEKVHDLLKDAKKSLCRRMLSSKDPDNFSLMKEITELDPFETPMQERTVYDLLWMLEIGSVDFWYNQRQYHVRGFEAFSEEQQGIQFEGRTFSSPEVFLKKAKIEGHNLNTIADQINNIDWSRK